MNASHEERASQSTTSDILQSDPLSSADTNSCATFPSPANISTSNNNSHRAHRNSISSCDLTLDPLCDADYDDRRANKNAAPNRSSSHSRPASKATHGLERSNNSNHLTQSNSSPINNAPLNTNRPTLQQQQQQQDPTYLYLRQQQQQQFNHHLPAGAAEYASHPWSSAHVAAPNPSSQRQYPSGVDKLIIAAMMEDAATTAAMTNAHKYSQNVPPHPQHAHYLPIGRGIGYLNNAQDSQIPTPSNKSELELYRLLERANLLNYFATFLSYGGDDVQQLSDADEDEFLEIMSLVGMTQKPLHVRRLQKALIEWRENKESESHFRRPSELFFTQNGNFNNFESNFHNNHRQQQQQIVNSAVFTDSPAPTPTSSSSQSLAIVPSDNSSGIGIDQVNSSNINSRSNQPHDVLVGAPKRPRLMDSLHQSKSSASKRSSSQSPQPV